MSSNIQCGLCRQTFDASEELCGDCREEVDDSWRANLSANLAAAGMAATMMGAPCDCYEERGMFSECYVHIARRTMREAVS